MSETKEVISRLRVEGWDGGARAVQQYTDAVNNTAMAGTNLNQNLNQTQSSFRSLLSGLSDITIVMRGAFQVFSQAMQKITEYQEAEDTLTLSAEKYGITATQMMNLVTEATRGQVESYEQLGQASNILLERVNISQKEYTDLLGLITTRSQQMGVTVEETLNKIGTSIASGSFNRGMVQVGFVTAGLREEFEAASTDTERFRILMSDLRDTVGGDGGEMSIADQFKELNTEINNVAAQGLVALVLGTTQGTNGISGMTSSVRDMRDEITMSMSGLGTFLHYLKEIWRWTPGGLLQRGLGALRNYAYSEEPGTGERGVFSDQTRQQAEEVMNAQQRYYTQQSSVFTGAQGTRQAVSGGGRGRAADVMEFTEEELMQQEIDMAAEITRIKQYQIEQEQIHIDQLRTEAGIYQEIKSQQRQQLEMQRQQLEEKARTVGGQVAGEQQGRENQLQQLGLSEGMVETFYGEGAYKQIITGNKEITASFYALGGAVTTFKESMAGAWSSITSGLGDYIVALIDGEEGQRQSLQKMLRNTFMTIGKESLVRALYEGGMSIASLAMWDLKGAASHGAAAGVFSGVAALTLGIGASIPKGATQSAASETAVAAPTKKASSVSGPQSINYYVNFSGGIYPNQRDLKKLIYNIAKEQGANA